jgi:ribose transport system ATP-binding protein
LLIWPRSPSHCQKALNNPQLLGIMRDAPLIELDQLSKRFGGVVALDSVSFAVRQGEVHAVVGENGAGKSTLMKLLAGIQTQDSGEIRIDGQRADLRSPSAARDRGVSIVFQELNLFPDRSVAANVFANREQTRFGGLVNRAAMNGGTREVLQMMEVSIDPQAKVSELSIGEQQLVEIARTLAQQSRIVILDEPNSALADRESERLLEIVRRLRVQGVTILYVSHRLEEVFAIADRITVLRNGAYQGTYETPQTSPGEIVRAMIGRSVEQTFPRRLALPADARVVLQVRDLSQGARLGPVNFAARAGEILGFAGLEGSGIDELFQTLFGLQRPTNGRISFHDQPLAGSPRDAIRQGVALIPESRREQGLMIEASIARNATLLVLEKLRTRLGLLSKRSIRRTAKDLIRRLKIVAHSPEQKVVNLSGGNQQKVLLAKWLSTGPSLLILNDPTRGVDIGAKLEIYQLCADLAAAGLTLLLTSSEADEILGLTDRVLVLCEGKVVSEFAPQQATKLELMHAMSGAELVGRSESCRY